MFKTFIFWMTSHVFFLFFIFDGASTSPSGLEKHVINEPKAFEEVYTVIGIDIGTTKITASASFSNGSVRYLTVIDTTEQYKNLIAFQFKAENAASIPKQGEYDHISILFPEGTVHKTNTKFGADLEQYLDNTAIQASIESIKPAISELMNRIEENFGLDISRASVRFTSILDTDLDDNHMLQKICDIFTDAGNSVQCLKDFFGLAERVYQSEDFFYRAAIARLLNMSVTKYRPPRRNKLAMIIFYGAEVLLLEVLDPCGNYKSWGKLLRVSYSDVGFNRIGTNSGKSDATSSNEALIRAAISSRIENVLRALQKDCQKHKDEGYFPLWDDCGPNDIDIVVTGDIDQANRDWLNLEQILWNVFNYTWAGQILDFVSPKHLRSIGTAMAPWDRVADSGTLWNKEFACRLLRTPDSKSDPEYKEICYFPNSFHTDGCHLVFENEDGHLPEIKYEDGHDFMQSQRRTYDEGFVGLETEMILDWGDPSSEDI